MRIRVNVIGALKPFRAFVGDLTGPRLPCFTWLSDASPGVHAR